MTTQRLLFMLLFITTSAHSDEPTFYRGLPRASETNKITADQFKQADAVILLRETIYGEGTSTTSWRGSYIATGDQTSTTRIVIAKLFNEDAVKHFGSFEYEFVDFPEIQDILKNKPILKFRARVMKPDSTVWTMPDSSVSTITVAAGTDDSSVLKKVLFKIPDLAPGDVVQIEYVHTQRFSDRVKRIFFYHDRYPVLYSNLSIYTPKKDTFKFLSFPPEKVGQPVVTEVEDAWLYSWGVRNLAAIPDEAFGTRFADASFFTAIVEKSDDDADNGWRSLARSFLWKYANKPRVNKSFMKELGLRIADGKPQWEEVDQVYAALRKYFKLERTNSIYPATLDKILEKKSGDASDIAYVMLKILDRWNVSVTPVLIRDRRDGIYEQSVATTSWFERMGLLISLDGIDKVYDFDPGIPTAYENPWFLHCSTVLALHDTGVAHLYLEFPLKLKDLMSKERHHVTLEKMKATDEVSFSFKAASAQRLREQLYTMYGEELTTKLRTLVEKSALRTTDMVAINNFRDMSEVSITARGDAQAAVNAIDSFLIFSPKNHLLRELRNKFSETERFGDIYFDEAFCYSMTWHVDIPSGYAPTPALDPLVLKMESGIVSQVKYNTEANALVIQADIIVGTQTVQVEKYRQFIDFLEKTMQSIERDITFVRTR
ncbi:MAG: DUF3857 domain-containing protein [Ignavibacteriae bacterium]|nr:DUF3857 domain-containing protein [Ignavibacteriota bacterium]